MNALRGENDELPWTAYSTGRTFNYMTVAYSGGPATAKAIDWAFSENATVGAYVPAMTTLPAPVARRRALSCMSRCSPACCELKHE